MLYFLHWMEAKSCLLVHCTLYFLHWMEAESCLLVHYVLYFLWMEVKSCVLLGVQPHLRKHCAPEMGRDLRHSEDLPDEAPS